MKTIILIITIIVSFTYFAGSQILNTYNLYHQEVYLINPAAIGGKDKINGFLNSRRSLIEFDDAPRTLTLGLCGAINENMGLGTKVLSDHRGTIESTLWVLSYSYRITFDEPSHNLTFGVSGGAARNAVNRNRVIANDMDDPTLNSDFTDDFSFEGDAGVWYQRKGLTLGFSAPHLYQFYHHYVIFGAYQFDLISGDLKIIPSSLLQTLPKSETQVDFNLLADYKDRVWISGTYRTNGNMVLGMGIGLENIRLGYAYEINNSDLSHISNSSHELVVSFSFGKKKAIVDVVEEQKEKRAAVKAKVENEQKNSEAEQLRQRVKMLEETILMERKMQDLEKELREVKENQKKLMEEQKVAKEIDSIVNITSSDAKEVEILKNDREEISMKSFIADEGYYVVVATLWDEKSAMEAAEKIKKLKREVQIIYEQNKKHFYICTGFSIDKETIIRALKKERIAGFSDAWLFILR